MMKRTLWLTSVAVLASRASSAQNVAVTINWNATNQLIDGFGVAQPGPDDYNGEDYAKVLNTFWAPARESVLDLAFSELMTVDGNPSIGLSMFRARIETSMRPSSTVWNDNNDPDQVALMKGALGRGPVRIIASPWTPPAWMKSNGSTRDGYLLPAHYQAYADYLSHYAKEWSAYNKVPIYAISPQNEPDTIGLTWATCGWTPAQFANFVGGALATTFAANNITAKVFGAEVAFWNAADAFLSPTYNSPSALARLDVVAAHWYNNFNDDEFDPSVRIGPAGKRSWMTETTTFDPTEMDSLVGALNTASGIADGLGSGGISAYFRFDLASARDDTIVKLIPATNAYHATRTFWAIGNYSKYVRPGFVALGTTISGTNAKATAFKNPSTGQLVIVVVNLDPNNRILTFSFQNYSAGYAMRYRTSQTTNLQPESSVPLTVPLVLPGSSIVTYVTDRVDQHQVFRGTDGHVHELFNNGSSWTNNDLTAVIGGTSPASSVFGYSLGSNQYLAFRDAANHLHVYRHTGTEWRDDDLTAITTGAGPVGEVFAYVQNHTQHIVYRSADNHVHELYHDGRAWTNNDLTTFLNGVGSAGNVTGYILNNTQHVVFRGTDGHLHDYNHNGSNWADQNLTALTGGATPAGDPIGYVLGNTQHIVFRSSDNHVRELYNNGSSWTNNDLTAYLNGASGVGNPFGYVLGSTQHIVFRSSNSHLHEYYHNGTNWVDNDLTVVAGGLGPASDPSGYIQKNTQHILYRSSDNHLHELYHNGTSWANNDLTAVVGGVGPSDRIFGYAPL
jgi:O-glycosyl hydrolase